MIKHLGELINNDTRMDGCLELARTLTCCCCTVDQYTPRTRPCVCPLLCFFPISATLDARTGCHCLLHRPTRRHPPPRCIRVYPRQSALPCQFPRIVIKSSYAMRCGAKQAAVPFYPQNSMISYHFVRKNFVFEMSNFD